MAIANVLESMKTHISNAYIILASKDTPMPEHKNLANLANTIENIPSTATDKLVQVLSDPSTCTPFNLTAEDLAGIVSLRPYAFYKSALNFIELPNTLTDIGAYAFSECIYFDTLQALVIPDSVQFMYQEVFKDSSIQRVVLGSGLTYIGYRVFANSGLYSLRIKGLVTTIAEEAFYNCSGLPAITLPASLTWIGERAFSGCQRLMHIVFQGTMVQWINIHKEENWDLNTPNYIVHCTDGDLPKQ